MRNKGQFSLRLKEKYYLDDSVFIRAGYSANASLLLEKKDSVMSIPEALLQFDKRQTIPMLKSKMKKESLFEKIN